MADKPVKVDIVGDSSNYKKALKEAQDATAGFAKKTEGHGKQIAAAGAVAAGAVGAFAASAIGAASDYNETVSKSKVIFDEASDSVIAFAKDAADSFGLSQQAALDAEATFATFGKGAGLAGNDLSAFAQDLTGLAADMASFSNTSPEQAIEAISAALRGESEPIRAYGVLLDDATLKQAALELGIYDGNGALTQQQKVMAAQKAIFDQTSDAQGDFARTSDGLAGKQKKLAAEFENVKVELGQGLIPIALKAFEVLQKLAFGGDAPKAAFEKLAKASKTSTGYIINDFEDLIKATQESRSWLDQGLHGWGNFFSQVRHPFEGSDIENVREFDKAFGDLLARDPAAAGDLVAALHELRNAADGGVESAKQWVDSYDLSNDKLSELDKTVTQVAATTEQATVANLDYTSVVTKLIDAVKGQEKAEKDNNDAIAKGIQAQRDLTQARYDAIPTADDLAQSIRDLDSDYYHLQLQEMENAKTQADGKISNGEKEQSNRDLATSEHDLAGKVFETAQKYSDANGAVHGTKHEQDLMRDSLELSKAKFPELTAVIDEYIRKLLQIPTSVTTDVGINAPPTVNGRKRKAAGGPVRAGEAYVVGEKRPELFVPDSNGTILPRVPDGSGDAGPQPQGPPAIWSGAPRSVIVQVMMNDRVLQEFLISSDRLKGSVS